MYSAALLWAAGWPFIISSILGAAVTLAFLLPALVNRIKREEADLQREFGQEYITYSDHTARLIPYVY
jgi:protein-S-isoprenylcysteine O-methyltransferase Ste14